MQHLREVYPKCRMYFLNCDLSAGSELKDMGSVGALAMYLEIVGALRRDLKHTYGKLVRCIASTSKSPPYGGSTQ